MQHQRRSDQTVEAFSAPKSLLEKAKGVAAKRGMTKSGFFRYCLAKELGYSDAEAKELAIHGALRNLISAVEDSTGGQDSLSQAHEEKSQAPKHIGLSGRDLDLGEPDEPEKVETKAGGPFLQLNGPFTEPQPFQGKEVQSAGKPKKQGRKPRKHSGQKGEINSAADRAATGIVKVAVEACEAAFLFARE